MRKIRDRKKNTNKKQVERLSVIVEHEDYKLLRKAIEEGFLLIFISTPSSLATALNMPTWKLSSEILKSIFLYLCC